MAKKGLGKKQRGPLHKAIDRLSQLPVPRRAKTPCERLVSLCRELDMKMDGVACPAAAAACLNGIRFILSELDQ